MNWKKWAVCVSVSALLLSALLLAQDKKQLNQYGIAEKVTVNFGEPFRVGATLLPKGDYEITHTMNGKDHIMVFRQLGVDKPIEVSAKCDLVKLDKAAPETRKNYVLNDAKERVLKDMVIKGDTAKHVFEQ